MRSTGHSGRNLGGHAISMPANLASRPIAMLKGAAATNDPFGPAGRSVRIDRFHHRVDRTHRSSGPRVVGTSKVGLRIHSSVQRAEADWVLDELPRGV